MSSRPEMKQLKHILVLLFLLPLYAQAVVFDSLQKEKLIEQGIFKLNALKASNAKKIREGKTNELNFIVNLEPDNNTDYINDYNLPAKPKFLSTATVELQLNNRLKQIFTEQFKECYLILISAFDVEIKAPVPEGLSAKDVFNKGKFFDEQSDIETHKAFHNDVVSQIANSNDITGNNRDCYVLSLGAYCGAFYANKVGCYYYWFTKKVDIQGNATVDYFAETYDYLNSYLRSSKDFKQPKSQDNMAEQVVTAFESAAKNAKLKAQILSTHTSPELEDILENFSTTEDYSTLSLAERIHILKVFLTSLTFSSSETYINNTLRTTATENINDLLNALLAPQNNINGTSMLTRLFSAIQGDNYTTFIKDICNLVGRSTLDGHNLPEDNISYDNLPVSSFGINESWYRAFEWTDCWNRLNPSDPNNPENVSLNACSWTNFEKRFSNIQIENDGYIKVTGKYDSGQSVITETGATVKTIETFERTYHPYDLVLFSNESSIETIDEANTEGVVVVPALFLKFAYDKAFNQGIYDVAYVNMSILGIFGVDEIMLASKALTKVPKMKSLLKWIWRGKTTANIGSLAQNLTGYLKFSYDDLLTKGFSAVEEADKIKFLDDAGRHLAEISNGKLIFKYNGYGGDIVISEGKVTTVLGKFAEDWEDINSNGTRYFLGSNNPIVKGFPIGSINRGVTQASPNRLNFLDLPESQYNTLINNNIKSELDNFLGSSSNMALTSQSIDEVTNLIKSNYPSLSTQEIDNILITGQNKGNDAFWSTYNLPFLEQAFQRGDNIKLVSDPTNTLTRTGTYKRELEAIENTLAQQYNYSYDPITKTYYKN